MGSIYSVSWAGGDTTFQRLVVKRCVAAYLALLTQQSLVFLHIVPLIYYTAQEIINNWIDFGIFLILLGFFICELFSTITLAVSYRGIILIMFYYV
uniref:Uncharacterized protein n=1 Tax=Wuchereria bancrofti TaxID=6293 RepID=A0A1I8EDS3_WUCBA